MAMNQGSCPVALCLAHVFSDAAVDPEIERHDADAGVIEFLMGMNQGGLLNDEAVIHQLMQSNPDLRLPSGDAHGVNGAFGSRRASLARVGLPSEARDNALIEVLMGALSPRSSLAHLRPDELRSRAAWSFVGPISPWQSLESEEEELVRGFMRFQTHADKGGSGSNQLDSQVAMAGLNWGQGGEMFALEQFVRRGGLAVIALDSQAMSEWGRYGKVAPSRQSRSSRGSTAAKAAESSKLQVRIPNRATLQAIAGALSFDLILLEDVVLRDSTLHRGWRLLTVSGEPITWDEFPKAQAPATLIFQTDPGLVSVSCRPWELPRRDEIKADSYARQVKDAAECLVVDDVDWPPTVGLQVRRHRVAGKMHGDDDLGTVSGIHIKVENGRPVEQVGWVVVHWDKGGGEPLQVKDLRQAEDTQDFLRRVYAHHVRCKNRSQMDGFIWPELASRHAERIRWRFVVVRGVSCENGSFCLWDPSSTQEATFTMPVRVLKACTESGGRAPAALLVKCSSTEDSIAAAPAILPIRGGLKTGDTVLVDAEALAGAGLQVENLTTVPWLDRHRYRKLRPVTATVIALSGNKEVYVKVRNFDDVYCVHGARVTRTDPTEGHYCAEGAQDPPESLRSMRYAECGRRAPCSQRFRPSSAVNRFQMQ